MIANKLSELDQTSQSTEAIRVQWHNRRDEVIDMQSERTEAPYAGLRVLELARVLAGPWIGQTLADLGAQVIKMESPEGDETRRWGPPFLTNADGSAGMLLTFTPAIGARNRWRWIFARQPIASG